MTEYRRKPTPVKAWQFQLGAPLPEFVSSYVANTPLGPVSIVASMGLLLIPTKGGVTLNAEPGEWLVLEDAFKPPVLTIVKPDAFEATFEAVETPVAEVVVEDAAPAPVETKAPEVDVPAVGRNAPTRKAAAAPAAEAPVAEAPAPAEGE